MRGAGGALVAALTLLPLSPPARAQQPTPAQAPGSSAAAPSPTPKPRPATHKELEKLIAAQQAQIAAQEALIERQAGKLDEQAASINELNRQLAEMRRTLGVLTAQLEVLEAAQANAATKSDLEQRLTKIQSQFAAKPEAPVLDLAEKFPGSFNIPGTLAAMKIGLMIWTSTVQTFSALGSDTQFLTYSIPAQGTPEAGQGPRLSLWAAPSRFNLDVRTPTEVGMMRAYLEADAAGANKTFRLRHAYFQYGRVLIGQMWSAFSDPLADHEDVDFEGLNAENVTRQAQIRVGVPLKHGYRLAIAAEYPTASIDGGQAVNQFPDLIAAVTKEFPGGHLRGSLVLRAIRGQLSSQPNVIHSAQAMGGSLSGVVPVGGRGWTAHDRVIFQVTAGKGIARYINDLNSCNCGMDASFGADGSLHALTAWGAYAGYEHHWEHVWNPLHLSLNNVHTSLIWGRVAVSNLAYMPSTTYKTTDRVSLSALWSPVPYTDIGLEYIWGQRTNQGGSRGTATQLQLRARFMI